MFITKVSEFRCKGLVFKVLVLGFVFTINYQLSAINCFAAGPGTTGAQFLKLGVGSRPVAMGEAFVAVADDVNAMQWNPAGLSQISSRQASLVATEWFQAIHYGYLGYCQPFLGGVIGAAGTFLWIDGIERRTTDTPTPDGWIVARDLAIAASYARALSKQTDIGGTVKIIYQQLDDRTATGVAMDLGLLYKLNVEKWTFGIALQNLGYESAFISEASSLPMNLKAGISNKYLPDKSGNYKLTFASDFNYGIMDNVWSIGAGIDWWIHPVFAVRCGYKYNSAMSSLGPLAGLTMGAGFKINIFDIDYALVPYGDLGWTNRISLLAKF